jgi:hypothetical protein
MIFLGATSILDNLIECAEKMERLKAELTTMKAREAEIQSEIQMLWQRMRELSPVAEVPEPKRKGNYPPREGVPRTLNSKVLIGTGRRIIAAAKATLPVDTARKNAIEAAQMIARKNGGELSAEIMEKIEEQLAMRYRTVEHR